MAKVLFIDVASEPKVIETDGSLRSLQALVGGSIEAFCAVAGETPLLWVNEEGLFTCQPNRAVYATRLMEEGGFVSQVSGRPVREGDLFTILHGPIVAASYDRGSYDDGEDLIRDITDEEIDAVLAALGPEGSGMLEAIALALGARRAS